MHSVCTWYTCNHLTNECYITMWLVLRSKWYMLSKSSAKYAPSSAVPCTHRLVTVGESITPKCIRNTFSRWLVKRRSVYGQTCYSRVHYRSNSLPLAYVNIFTGYVCQELSAKNWVPGIVCQGIVCQEMRAWNCMPVQWLREHDLHATTEQTSVGPIGSVEVITYIANQIYCNFYNK